MLTIERRQELHSRLTLLDSFIEEQKLCLKSCKGKVKMAQAEHAKCKVNLETYRVQRGKPEASILTEVEQLLESFKISSAAYHGGEFNGVCCRRLVANAKVITDEVRGILFRKKDESCETDEIQSKIDALEALLGLIDAAFAYLNIDHPTEDEKKKARESVDALSHYWRSVGLSVTLKAHVMEKHVSEFNDKWGIGEKEESFIEQGHQIGVRDNRRYAGLTNFVKKTEATLKQRCNASHPLVVQQQQKVIVLMKRNKGNEAINTK